MTSKELMNIMNQINYGYDNNYKLQSPNQLLKSKVGICFDQVELERYFLNNYYRLKTFFIIGQKDNNYHTHTFLVYEKNNFLYWFEHSWKKYQGIHKYGNYNDLFKDIVDRFSLFYKLNKDYITIFEYDKPNYGISSDIFIKYCQNGKLVLDKSVIQDNILKIHTTDMGIDRIKKNLKLYDVDVLSFLKDKIISDNIYLSKKGKNFYLEIDDIIITINSYNYSIITAHVIKKRTF